NYNDPAPGPGVPGSTQHPRPLQAIAPTLANMLEVSNVLSSNYNSLQVKLTKNFSNGLQFLATYAYAHALGVCGSTNFSSGCSPQNPDNRYADYGDSSYDVRHTVTLSGVYDLPVGNGKRFLSGESRIENLLLGGWELTGIFHYNGGVPYNLSVPFDLPNTGPQTLSVRPDYVAGLVQSFTGPTPGTITGFLNPNAFVLQPQYTFGNLGYNTLRSPAFWDQDAGLFKNFYFDREKYQLQFRSEYFNLFNNHNFGCVDSGLTDPGFGQARCMDQSGRIVQLALKFRW
ncbi:MAG: hypothetical protein ACREBW_06125, partial [Candidatus Micrarchaeaceae archaeon]